MPLTYVSTCAGGGHHTFVDEKGVTHVFTTEQLAEDMAAAVRATEKVDAIPVDIKADINAEIEAVK